jgi:hypothetical protein
VSLLTIYATPFFQDTLYQAINTLDVDRILELTEAARQQAPDLADTLAQWAHDFEYDKMRTLISPET